MPRGFRDEDRETADGHEPFSLGEGECIAERELAIRVILDSEQSPRWIPKANIHAASEVWSMTSNDGKGKIVIKRWFAVKEGLVDE